MSDLQPVPLGSVPQPTYAGSGIDMSHPSVPVAEIAGPGLKRDSSGVLEYWQMIRRHRGVVILVTFVGVVLGLLVTLSQPRIYQARTTLEVEALNDEFLGMRNVNPTSAES